MSVTNSGLNVDAVIDSIKYREPIWITYPQARSEMKL